MYPYGAGTWCIPELEKVVEKGYKLKYIHEVWNFPKEQQQTGLFARYVKQSSGWPRKYAVTNADCVEQRRQYLDEYKQQEGIWLDYRQMRKKPGRKSTAKLMLNSFWGKFGELQNKFCLTQVTSPGELFDLLNSTVSQITCDLRICTCKPAPRTCWKFCTVE